MKIAELIKQPEGRRHEFKAKLPAVSDIAKTIVAFANDAGGELFIGIRNEPRELVGVKEDTLIRLEEQISNIIHDGMKRGFSSRFSLLKSRSINSRRYNRNNRRNFSRTTMPFGNR